MTPLLSVIVPVNDTERHIANLENLFESAPSKRFELIIVHDVAPGEDSKQLIQLCKRHPAKTIKLLEGHFGNPGQARNLGLQFATGSWLTFCDSDDHQHFKAILDEIDRDSSPDLMVGQFNRVSSNGSIVDLVSTRSFPDLWVDPGFWRVVYKRSVISGIEFTKLKMGEDILFLSDVIRRNPQVSFRDALFYDYTIGNPLQLTSNSHNFEDLATAIQLIKQSNPSWSKNINDTGFLLRLALTQFRHSRKWIKLQSLGELLRITHRNPGIFFQFVKKIYFQRGGP